MSERRELQHSSAKNLMSLKSIVKKSFIRWHVIRITHGSSLKKRWRNTLSKTSKSKFGKFSFSQPLCGALVLTASALGLSSVAKAEDTIKVGVLHSLSGTMAISETTLKDTMLMLIDEQNKKGGLLGKQLEAVVVDPASDWPLFAEKNTRADRERKGCGDLRCVDIRVT